MFEMVSGEKINVRQMLADLVRWLTFLDNVIGKRVAGV